MKRSYFALFVVFVGSIVLLIATSLPSVAASFSGRVIDAAGQPVEGLIIALPSFPGNAPPHQHQRFQGMFPPAQPSETDATGAFSITDIATPSVSRLTLFPEHNSDYEIRSVEIEGIAFHFDQHQQHFGGLNFAIASDTDIKDVEITVRLRMRIRGRVLSADGTPLSNARVDLRINRRKLSGGGGGGGGTRTLDPDGYFVEYLNQPAYYSIIVRYQGQSVESEEILLEDGQRLNGLVLTLGNKPEPAKPERVVIAPPAHDPVRFEAARKREREGIWAINPDNRHAYKMIRCETREAAQAQAAAQDAHLVAINDAAEEQWILEVFGRRENFWIGLTDGIKEGKLQWDNGESITYTNWNSSKETAESTESTQTGDANQNYIVLVGLTEKWQVARQGSPLIGMTERAILEKENFIIGTPDPKANSQKR